MDVRRIRQLAVAAVACWLLALSPAVQGQAKPSANPSASVSRFDVYGGYAYLHPLDAQINGFKYEPLEVGAVASATYYFTKHYGVQAEAGLHVHGPNDCVTTAQGGLVARTQFRRFVPFVHVLGGGAKVGGPVFQPCTWGYGGTAGVGLDYVLPYFFNDRVAVRPIQADYEYNHVDFGPLVLPGGYSGGLLNMNAYRLSGGLVLRFGNKGDLHQPVMLSCDVQPMSAYAGEPMVANATTLGLKPNRKTDYVWSSTGGTIVGRGETAQMNTTGLTPGTYTVNGRVSQGTRVNEQATCNAVFEIKLMEPPTITCSATPASVLPGGSSTVTSVGLSPSKRPLTYSYTASSGTITGAGTTAALDATNTLPGSITVTCNVVDDMGKSAMATTSVTVTSPVIPPVAQTQSLCSINFNRNRKLPARVDNEAKACLDDVALTLQRQTTARLVIVGSREPSETPDVAAQRAVNTKLYLTREKQIDPSRLSIRSGHLNGRRVDHTLVPAGATFNADGTDDVDENAVHSVGQPYGVTRDPAVRRAVRQTRLPRRRRVQRGPVVGGVSPKES